MTRAGAMVAIMLGTAWIGTLAPGADAGGFGVPPALDRPAGPTRPTRVDWQDPAMLPPPFRNHCTSGDGWWGRPYCADHCGRGDQFYFCSPASFGCCHVGYGYCDDRGHLRCHP